MNWIIFMKALRNLTWRNGYKIGLNVELNHNNQKASSYIESSTHVGQTALINVRNVYGA